MSAKKKNLYLHIGYPKTATTMLQKHYFPKLEGVFYSGIRYDENPRFFINDSAIKALILADVETARNLCKETSESLLEVSKDLPILLSLEKIIGSFFTPRRIPSSTEQILTTPERAAATIKELFGGKFFNLKLIITIRKQVDALPSKYAQSFSSAYFKFPPFDTFPGFVRDILYNDKSCIRSGFDYDHVVSVFESNFNSRNIQVLPYELLRDFPEDFLRNICRFMEITYNPVLLKADTKENVRQQMDGGRQYSKISLLNVIGNSVKRIFPRLNRRHFSFFTNLGNISWPWQKEPGDIALNDDERERIELLFAKSNKSLSQRYSLDLNRFGYFSVGEEN